MGMYDSVYIYCWKCGERIELQSKSGDCILAEYTLEDVPIDVIGGLANETGTCPKCKSGYKICVRTDVWIQPNDAQIENAKIRTSKPTRPMPAPTQEILTL